MGLLAGGVRSVERLPLALILVFEHGGAREDGKTSRYEVVGTPRSGRGRGVEEWSAGKVIGQGGFCASARREGCENCRLMCGPVQPPNAVDSA